ncbi:MAG: hypothetical protein JW984_04500 [Deltaproteobacteria bacterium]|uniref:DUF4328 domain-containing protein n=1 Tax=Candidatus Zymogenus saltonus TaxID=2844893 RepID=A0A9D8KD11_9DELT|nr:hypothetical protein [Candidatus Zymogenus saltonus]
MTRMSKSFYLGSFIGATVFIFFLAIIVLVAAAFVPNIENLKVHAMAGLIFFVIICIAVGIYLVVVTGMFFYKMWDAIRDREIPVSPALAVVLLLIPIVNFFWALLVYPMYVKYYNEYIGRRAVDVHALSPGLFYAYPALLGIYIVCMVIAQAAQIAPGSTILMLIAMPFSIVGMVASIASFVVFFIIVSKVCDAVNILPSTTAGGGMIRSARIR